MTANDSAGGSPEPPFFSSERSACTSPIWFSGCLSQSGYWLEFAEAPEQNDTLSRAARDFLKKDTRFSLEVGRLALQRILEGYGYDLTGIDVLDAFNHYIAAAQTLGLAVPRGCARHGDETARDGQRHSHSPVLG